MARPDGPAGSAYILALATFADGEALGLATPRRQAVRVVDHKAWTAATVVALTFLALIGAGVLVGYRIRRAWARTEADLRASEARFRAIFESTTDCILVWDRDYNCLYANQAAIDLAGSTPERLVGGNMRQGLAHLPDFRDLWMGRVAQVFETGESLRVEDTAPINGRVVSSESILSPIRDERGEIVAAACVYRDITERKQIAEALLESGERLKSVVENVGVGIALISPKMEILDLNRQMREWFPDIDSSTRPICYRSYNVPPFDEPCPWCPTLRTLRDGQVHESVTQTPTRDEVRHYRIVASPIHDAEGRVAAAIEMVDDITDAVRAARDLRNARDEAEAANRAKSDFLANMSHEIRTPLNAIVGMTDLALETGLTHEQRDYLDTVRSSSDALLALVNDILDFSKIEAGHLDLEEIDFGLRELVEEAVAAMGLRAHRKDLELTCQVPPDAPARLRGDPGRLRQVLINLIGNAVKFTKEGEVEVRAETVDRSDAEVLLRFEVRDTGIGIPLEKQAAVFDAFSQADASTTRRYGGTGLGLAISAHIVELMGGSLSVESEPGRGSVFRFTARFGLTKAAPAKDEAPPVDVRGMAALVVDDNATNRRILEEMLVGWGLRPALVEDGEAALKAMRRAVDSGDPFGLVLVDSQMPRMSGFDLAEAIRREPDFHTGAVMMLSSADRRGDARRCRELGVKAYLVKPVRQSDLLNAILTALGAEGGAAERVAGDAEEPSLPPLTVLLVEDNPVNQNLTLRTLEKRGHRAVVAATGREALEALRRETFDLILMDVQMPEMDGYEATRRIREGERDTGERIPILAMTAHAMKGDRESCLAAGMDGYVAKPLRPADLMRAMASILGGGAGAAPATAVVFDREAVLAYVGGNTETLHEVLGVFLDRSPEMLADVAKAVADEDAHALEQTAHRLKSSLRNVGGRRAAETSERLEALGRERRAGQAGPSLDRLQREWQALCEALRSALSGNESEA